MTTTYYIEDTEIVTSNAIGVSIERYHSADYWKARLYLADILSPTIMALLVPNTTITLKISDDTGDIEYTGTLSYWGTSEDYSFVDIVNCTVVYTPAP